MATLELIEGLHAGLLSEGVDLFLSDRSERRHWGAFGSVDTGMTSERHPEQRAKKRAEQLMRWQHMLHPPEASLSGRLWLARSEGRWRGVLLGIPMTLVEGTRRWSGLWGVDLYVPPSARRLGVGSALLSRWRDEAPLAVGLGITDSAWRLEQRLGWTVRLLPPLQAAVLSRRAALALGLRQGGIPSPVVSAPDWSELAPQLEAWDAGALEQRLPPFLQVQQGVGGPRLERTLAWYTWRMQRLSGVVWLGVRAELHLVGVLAVQRQRRFGLLQLRVLEQLSLPGHEQRLVESLLSYAKAADAELILLRGTEPQLRRAAQARGFFPWGPCERLIVHTARRDEGEQLLFNPWQLTLLDSGNLS